MIVKIDLEVGFAKMPIRGEIDLPEVHAHQNFELLQRFVKAVESLASGIMATETARRSQRRQTDRRGNF
jgi:hypothetical protein